MLPVDYSGLRVGALTAIRMDEERSKRCGRVVWLFRCDCGGETYHVPAQLVCNNRSRRDCKYPHCKSCVYAKRKEKAMADVQAKTKLTVLRRDETTTGSELRYYCRCACGAEIRVHVKQLLRGMDTCRVCAVVGDTAGANRKRERLRQGLTLRDMAKTEGVSAQAILRRELSVGTKENPGPNFTSRIELKSHYHEDDWITLTEASILRGLSRSGVYGWVRAGHVRSTVADNGRMLARYGDVMGYEPKTAKGRKRKGGVRPMPG